MLIIIVVINIYSICTSKTNKEKLPANAYSCMNDKSSDLKPL